jgi:small subunit ribosomal protein S6
MRRYETISIIDPDISDESREGVFDRIKNLITEHDGTLIEFDEWGARRLAYEIRKKYRGYYLRIDYCGTGTLVAEMERFFRIDDGVMKYMTVLLEKDVDMEKIIAEIEHARELAKADTASEAVDSNLTEDQLPDEKRLSEMQTADTTDSDEESAETHASDQSEEEK